MTKEDIKRKLCSRKFWVAVVGLVTGLLLLFGVDKSEVEQIGGIVLTAGSIIAYILGEGIADANSGDVLLTENVMTEEDDDGN